MPYIKGVDDQNKTHWLTSRCTWGIADDAHNFRPSEASAQRREIHQRNLYLNVHDRIVPTIVESVK